MKFTLKKYQIFKLKTYFKEKDFLIFHCAKLNLKQWMVMEQQLKKLKLKYYKPFNGVSLKIFNNSTHKNFSYLISGPILIVEYNSKLAISDLFIILKMLEPDFVLLSIKLNNNIYTSSSVEKLKTLNYKSNKGNFCHIMDNLISVSYLSC